MEDAKLQALHDSLSKLRGHQGLGNTSRYSWQKKDSLTKPANSNLPNNTLYSYFVPEGTYDPTASKDDGDGRAIKRDFTDCNVSDDDDSLDEKRRRKLAKKQAAKEAKLEAKRLAKLEEKKRLKKQAKKLAKEQMEKEQDQIEKEIVSPQASRVGKNNGGKKNLNISESSKCLGTANDGPSSKKKTKKDKIDSSRKLNSQLSDQESEKNADETKKKKKLKRQSSKSNDGEESTKSRGKEMSDAKEERKKKNKDKKREREQQAEQSTGESSAPDLTPQKKKKKRKS